MGVIVSYKKNHILDCSNGVFYSLYEKIEETIEEQNIKPNEILQQIIKNLELCTYGYTMSFDEYVGDKETMLQFLSILSTAIKKLKKDIPGLVPTAEERLWNFHRNLEKIIDEQHNMS